MSNVMITTADNPYDPFTEFDKWYVFDSQKGYGTCSLLARISDYSDELSPADQELAIEDAIDRILFFNVTGNYRKVRRGQPLNQPEVVAAYMNAP